MGASSISSSEMRSYYESSTTIRTASRAEQVFRSSCLNPKFDPSKIKLPREACDSALSPHSRGIIFAEDVTGSMGRFLLSLIQEEFPRLINQTYESVTFNPHIMFMAVGDVAARDEAPLQVTQFETDLRILDQLQEIWLEKGGGINPYESYILPWYFAGKHVKMDCYDKRGEKGFLFTFGDEEPTPKLTKNEIKEVFDKNSSIDEAMLTDEDCLEMASKMFYCYHVILHGKGYGYCDMRKWKKLLGGHALDLSDHKCLPELVATIFRMYEGKSKIEAINVIENAHARDVVTCALVDHEEHVSDVASKDTTSKIDVF